MNAELARPLPFSSAWPSTWRDFMERDRPEVRVAPPTLGVAQVQRVWEESGARVFVATGTAVPDPDWAWVSVAAEPSRTALFAALWDRITRSVQMVGGDDGSMPVPADSMVFARELLSELPKHLELPQASVSQDGELIFTWFRHRDCLSATIEPDQYLTWVFRMGSRIEDGEVIAFGDTDGRRRLYDAVAQFYE